MPRDIPIPDDQKAWLAVHGFKESGGRWRKRVDAVKWPLAFIVSSGALHNVSVALYMGREAIVEEDADTVIDGIRNVFDYIATRFGAEFLWELWWSPLAEQLVGPDWYNARAVSGVCKSLWVQKNE